MLPESSQAAAARPRAITRMWWPLAGLVLLVFAAATVTRTDADLWGHLRFGLDTLHTHRLTSVDPYSFTQDRPWINHEWLSEVQMGLAYAAAGAPGLALLKAAFAFSTFALIWSSLRGAHVAARAVVMVLVAFGTIHMTSSLRPQLWTFLFFALLCRALVDPSSRVRRWLPVLFALWANAHGGWIVGLGVLGGWAGAEICLEPGTLRRWAMLVLACILATLCTPYGWKLWQFIAQTVRMNRAIQEWQPLWGTPVLNWLPWFVGVAAVIWVAVTRRTRQSPAIAVLGMLAYASSRVMRIESLFVIAVPILLGPIVIERWPATLVHLPADRSKFEWIAALVTFGVPSIVAIWIMSRSLPCIPTSGPWASETQAVRLLAHADSGRLVTYFDWGEYAIWHLGPRLRVSMDGRRETVYTERRIAENDAIVGGTPAGLDLLAQWRPEYLWLPTTSSATREWLVEHGYRIDLQTPKSFVGARADRPAPLLPPASGGIVSSCFPG